MLPPVTASPDRSIWKRATRISFEASTAQLDLAKPELKPYEYPAHSVSVLHEDHPLPFDVERQLADDFAFFAAWDSGVDFVSAATVGGNRKTPGLTICLASNQGVASHVEAFFKEVLSDLESCAQKRLRREECTAKIFHLVVQLHLKKIQTRLGFRRPKYERAPPRGNVFLRLKSLLSRFDSVQKPGVGARYALFNHLDILQSMAEEIRAEPASEDLDTVKILVRKVFDVVSNAYGCSFDVVLAEVGLSRAAVDSRAIRDLEKLANYWRICAFMSEMCRSYRTSFSTMELKVLEHFRPIPASMGGSGNNLFVHAEIQILAYFELGFTESWPRAIGASKEACFLCDAFISAHGLFRVTKAHRQLFRQWTVPDLREYGDVTIERLSQAILQTKRSIERETRTTRAINTKRGGRQPWHGPNQSSVNLHNPKIPVGSVTSNSNSSLSKLAAGTATPQLSRRSSGTATPKPYRALTEQAELPEQLMATATMPLEIALDHLILYVYFEDTDLFDEKTVKPESHHQRDCGPFSGGSISVDRDPDCPNGEYVELSNLPVGMDQMYSVSSGEQEDHCLKLTIGNRKGTPVQITCKWHR